MPGSWGLGGDELAGVRVDVVEVVVVVVVVVVGVVCRHMLDAGGDAPHRLHVRLRGCPALCPPPFVPSSPLGSHAPSRLSLWAPGSLALALGPLSSPLPVSRVPPPVPHALARPLTHLPSPCPLHLGSLPVPLRALPVPWPLPGPLRRVAMMRVAGGRGAGLDPHRVRGVLLFVRRPPVGGCGSPPRGLRYLREEGRESGGGGGGTACTLGGGGCGLAAGCTREGDRGAVSSAAERHRAADRAEERPGLAKIGRGAKGARGDGGAAVGGGARTPLSGDESRRASSTGGESWWRRGGAPRRPLAAEPDRDGPRRWDTGGAGGAGHRGSGARVPGGCGPARGRPGGPMGCGW